MRTLTCTNCSKTFEALDDNPMKGALGGSEDICYNCALLQITGGRAPEEGDFNSARIISGEMTKQEWRWLQEDLRAVEEGRSIREYEDDDWDDYEDPAWCYACDRDTAFCECICYRCYEYLEECECVCALCDTPSPGRGLCDTHASEWDESVQGPIPLQDAEEIGNCERCGVIFNKVYEVDTETSATLNVRRLSRHRRKKCLHCHAVYEQKAVIRLARYVRKMWKNICRRCK